MDGLQSTLGNPEWRAMGMAYWDVVKETINSSVRARVRDSLGWVQLNDGQLVRVGPMPGCEERERMEQHMADTRFMGWVQRYSLMDGGEVGLRPDYNARHFEEREE